ncbi:MAG: NfeD family protein [Clostridiales bacterium]|nr:NfeD family protein [Clostridiales bacterium]
MAYIYWLIIFIVLVAFEIATLQLVSIWFAVGAVGGLIVSLLGGSLEIQLCVFLAISLVLLLAVKPLADKLLKRHVTKTNVDSLIGQKAKVTSIIDNQNGFGSAVVKGQEWTAVSADDNVVIPPGKMVVILRISGVKLIVREKK